MELTRTEENRNRAISAGISLGIGALLLLFFLLFAIVTPNPPFPIAGGGGGQELALGLLDVGNDNVDFGAMGRVTDVVAEKTPQKEDIVTSENGEDIQLTETKKHDAEVITPVKPKEVVKEREKTAAEKLAEKFKKNTGKSGGGIGDNEEAGDNGAPGGNPGGHGQGGSGGGTGGGDGTGNGTGEGPGNGPGFGGGKYGIDLKGRAVVQPPKLPKDTREEGKVVVEIIVDSEGNVIDANPNGRGTTTGSALLKAKARQAALATKFNVDGRFEEQKGTITIIFSFN